jgi:hypothetical protein
MTIDRCQYGNHTYETGETGTGFIYSDAPHGITVDTLTCPLCYLAHMRRFYPDSKVTAHFAEHMTTHYPNASVGMFYTPATVFDPAAGTGALLAGIIANPPYGAS